jgi:hypothetical protein
MPPTDPYIEQCSHCDFDPDYDAWESHDKTCPGYVDRDEAKRAHETITAATYPKDCA